MTTAICRFAALDQLGQVERFARNVLPLVQGAAAATAQVLSCDM